MKYINARIDLEIPVDMYEKLCGGALNLTEVEFYDYCLSIGKDIVTLIFEQNKLNGLKIKY
jgi:hypothetical protein